MALIERLKPGRPSSSGANAPNSPSSVLPAVTDPRQRRTSRPSLSSRSSSSRLSTSRLWVQGRQRRIFLQHLAQWSLDHDSSLHFQGKLSLLPQESKSQQHYELGTSVHCILTDTSFTDARQKIVIRLFPPAGKVIQEQESETPAIRRDSMDPLSIDLPFTPTRENIFSSEKDDDRVPVLSSASAEERYKLVVRCGAGWISAREYFNKLYLSREESRKTNRQNLASLDDSLKKRSEAVGPIPLDKDSVVIRPLFRPFLRLPPEIQELILSTAAGLTRNYNLCSDEYGIPRTKKSHLRSPISLATLFGVSKSINYHLVPHVYHSTNFEFGLTGFTNFLWQSGPTNRPRIRRLTFHFGKMALLHCIRWLAPNPIFSLFEPPVATNPRSLQYFWRCQIQDLTKDLHLLSLTINVKHIPTTDLPMVVAIMQNTFGKVSKINFVETCEVGNSRELPQEDERIRNITNGKTWREMCQSYYARHRRFSYFFKFELLRGEMEEIEKTMDCDAEFFDSLVI